MAVQQQLWGSETMKAVENFPVSGEPVPTPVVRWLGRIKAEAARVNAELGLLDADIAERVARAGDEVAAGQHDDQFPIDVFQTGSGTSSNMNANEVIANLAGEGVHPNDHVNMGQSSNDVFPSAVHLAAVDTVQRELLPALENLAASLAQKSHDFSDLVKAGRTHMMDAVPVTLGQEFGGYAAQIQLGHDRVQDALKRASQVPLGGTATGTGLNTHPEFAGEVRERLGLGSAPLDRFEAQGNRDGLVELHGALKGVAVSLTKIAQDLVLMGSGPRTGLAELRLPELQKGSSIMPGKVNPVMPEVVLQVAAQVIGNDTAVTRRRHAGQLRAERARADDGPQRVRLDHAAHVGEPPARGEVRGRARAQRGEPAPPRRVHPRDRDGAEPLHRLRPRHRDRAGGREIGPHDPRGRDREGRRRGDSRQGSGPARDGARVGYVAE